MLPRCCLRQPPPRLSWTVVGHRPALGKDRKGDFSPAIFLNDYAGLSDAGKRLLFHSVGSGDLIPHLDAIKSVSQDFVRAGKPPVTAVFDRPAD
jgi:hypothetical protein